MIAKQKKTKQKEIKILQDSIFKRIQFFNKDITKLLYDITCRGLLMSVIRLQGDLLIIKNKYHTL